MTEARPQGGLESLLARLWSQLLGTDDPGFDTSFFDLGGDSFQAVKLIDEIERQIGVALPISSLVEAQTITDLARLIRRAERDSPWKNLVPITTAGNWPPMFCAPAGAGSVFKFRLLAQLLSTEQSVYALRPKQVTDGPAFEVPLEHEAAYFIAQMREVRPEGPYVLAGFSFGGVVAYEMAQQLLGRGEEVLLLCLLDAELKDFLGDRLRDHLRGLGEGGVGDRLGYLAQKLGGRVDRARRLLQRGKRKLAQEPMPFTEQKDRFLHFVQRARRRYRPKSYSGSAILVQGSRPCAHHWRPLIQGDFEVHTIECGHTDLFERPHIEVMAERLNARLQQANGAR